MQTNKIDKHIADKFKDRELKPSASAWERLHVQLDKEHRTKKKKNVIYLSYVASIAMLVSLFFIYQKNNNNKDFIKNTIVNTSFDSLKMKEVNLKEISTVKEAIVSLETPKKENKKVATLIKKPVLKEENKNLKANTLKQKEATNVVLTNQIKRKESVNAIYASADIHASNNKKNTTRVTVNSDDLLFAVTHSSIEVKEYYAKYKIKRAAVLDTIQKELIKSNLKINPAIILAEVEYDIEEADFQENFMKKFKSKVSNVIVAIADRNK